MPESKRHVVEGELAEEVARLHLENYGKGAGLVRAIFSEDAIVVFLDELELQRNEEYLIEAGHGNQVAETRSHFQAAIEMTYRAAVERITGRRVISFASITKLDPNYAVEIFRLAPESTD